jgi:SAM-dependent methyltransferase
LRELAGTFAVPATTRVLDLGCGGGRNAVWLAVRGFDVWAVDASVAMVAETRRRLAAIQGESEASRRCTHQAMDRLDPFESGSFDLVVAFGVLQSAASAGEWNRALTETSRVLAPGALLMVANFTPRMDPGGTGLRSVPGSPHVYEGFASGRSYLLDGPDLDAAFGEHGLKPWVPTRIVERPTEKGNRSTANALYVKRGGRASAW